MGVTVISTSTFDLSINFGDFCKTSFSVISKWSVYSSIFSGFSSFLSIRGISPLSKFPSPLGEGLGVRCSTLLEDIATPEAKAKGLDVADFMINQLRSKMPNTENKNQISEVLNDFINRNNAVKILIDKLQLTEIL
jgi:hypothetical protein